MKDSEKQELCVKILKELILLRGVLCTTHKLYTACSAAIFNAWDEGLGAFIDNKFFAPVISKYSLLFKNNSSTLVSLPLKIKSPILISLFSSEMLTGTIENSEATPSALLWCGLGRTETTTGEGFEMIPVIKLQNPSTVSARIAFQENSHILSNNSLTALVHLLHFGKTELLPRTFSEVAWDFYTAACNLAVYAFRSPPENLLKLAFSEPLDTNVLTWLETFSKNTLVSQTIAKDRLLKSEAYLENFFQIGENYYKIAETVLTKLPPPELFKAYSFSRNSSVRLFDLKIESGNVTKFQTEPLSKKDFCLWLGDETGAIMGSFPRKIEANFSQGLIVAYLTLMSIVTEEGLLKIAQGLPEVKFQYLSYLNTMLTVQAAFGPQILATLV